VVGQVCVSHLLVGTQAELHDMFHFLASDLTYLRTTPGTLRMTSSTSIWQ
jgi:hypothetical protein